MVLYAFACLSVMAAAILLELTSKEGIRSVSPKIWYAVLAVLGVWLLVLEGAGLL